MDSLRDNLVFPVCAYIKSNGFLAMISADPIEDGKLFIASKSTNEGDFAGYIRYVLDKTLTTAQQTEFAENICARTAAPLSSSALTLSMTRTL